MIISWEQIKQLPRRLSWARTQVMRPSLNRTINKYSALIKFKSWCSCHIMPKAIRFDTSDACGPWTWTWTCPQNQFYRARSATFSTPKSGKWKIVSTTTLLFVSVRFRSVLCSVLCLLTRQFRKENRNAFIYSWTTCHAGMSNRQAGRQANWPTLSSVNILNYWS